jgi:hypothetical protein
LGISLRDGNSTDYGKIAKASPGTSAGFEPRRSIDVQGFDHEQQALRAGGTWFSVKGQR